MHAYKDVLAGTPCEAMAAGNHAGTPLQLYQLDPNGR